MDAIKEMADALPLNTDKFASPRRQNFSFHEASFIKYFTKNCSGIVYEKLLRTCKYFYSVERIVAVKGYTEDRWSKSSDVPLLEKIVKSTTMKLWFTGKMNLYSPANSLIEFMWRCDVTELDLHEQELTAAEFSKITKNVKKLNFYRSKVFSGDGQRLTIGDILAMIPQIVEFDSDKNTRYDPITIRRSNNVLPNLPHLKRILLSRVPNSFDYNEVCEFMKKHPEVHFHICFIKRHWDFDYHGAFMKAVKKAFPRGKTAYKCEYEHYNDRSAYHGDRTWSLTLGNMKVEIFGEGD